MKRIILLLISLSTLLIAQPEKVIGVENDNSVLFDNGKTVKMAGIDLPNRFHPDSNMCKFAIKLADTLESQLVGNYFFIERDNTNREIGTIPLVHLRKRVDAVNFINLNELFLERGYGIFNKEIEDDYLSAYKLAGNKAKLTKRGCWSILPKYEYEKLQFLSQNEIEEIKKEILDKDSGLIRGLKIRKVLDANLFELSNGVQFKMAGIDVPSIVDTDSDLRNVANEALNFAKSNLKGFKVSSKFFHSSKSKFPKTYLRREYTLSVKDFQEIYLKKGFAKIKYDLIPEYSLDYNEAQNDAISDFDGIWKHGTEVSHLILDKELTEEDILNRSEHLKYKDFQFIPEKPSSAFVGEVLVGGLGAIVGGLVGGYSSLYFASEGGWDDIGYAIIGLYGGSILGGSFGVYSYASTYDPDLYYSEVLGVSLITGMAVLGLGSQIERYGDDNYIYVALLAPLITAVLFVETSYEPPVNYSFGNERRMLDDLNLTHQDIYNNSKFFDFNILRIKF